MDHFSYKEGILHAEEVSIQEIAKEVGTPFYIYSTATLRRHFDLFESALSGVDHLICYAVKAASNQAILKTLAKFRGSSVGRPYAEAFVVIRHISDD